jgi:hypothetical protein
MMPTTFLMMLQEAGRAETALEGIKHPDLSKFLVISAILLIIGIAGVLTRRNLLVIFMSIELILNAANLNFIAFLALSGRYGPRRSAGGSGIHRFHHCGGRRRSGDRPGHRDRTLSQSGNDLG